MKSILGLSILMCFIFIYSLNLYSCTPDEYEDCQADGSCVYFLNPHLFDQENQNDNSNLDLELANIREWKEFFNSALSEEQLKSLIFKLKIKDIDDLIFSLQGKNLKLSPEQMELVKSLSKTNDIKLTIKALYYLGFAKRCEPYARKDDGKDPWEIQKERENPPNQEKIKEMMNEMNSLIVGGEKLLNSVSNSFLLQRYYFQLLRLKFYSKNFKGVKEFYDLHESDFRDNSSIKYRSLEFVAGSLFKEKNYALSNYLYSQIYDLYPPLKNRAYLAFHPQEESDWQASLALAKTTREKIVLWQLLGLYSDGIRAIKTIYSLDPKSDVLPSLLLREVQKNEEIAFPYYKCKTANQGKCEIPSYNKEVINFIKDIADKSNTLKPYLWFLSLAHLYALDGDQMNSNLYREMAKKMGPQNPMFDHQLKVTKLFANINGASEVDDKLLTFIYNQLTNKDGVLNKKDKNRNLTIRIHLMLTDLFQETGDYARVLLVNINSRNPIYKDNTMLSSTLPFFKKSSHTPFDLYWMKESKISVDLILETIALNHLSKGEFNEASSVFNFQSLGPNATKLKDNPFSISTKFTYGKSNSETKEKDSNYNLETLTKKIVQLLDRNKQNTSKESFASRYYQLGNIFFNLSYYGNARNIISKGGLPNIIYYYLWESLEHLKINKWDSLYFIKLAEEYYNKAISESTDKEFQAKATFLAAKCEYIRTKDDKIFRKPNAPDFLAGIYFNSLKNSFSNTKFYKEILEECGYFKKFATK